MAIYHTEQKKLLIDFLKTYSDKSFTIDEIVKTMKDAETTLPYPGLSTVYRLMPKLVADGLVKRFSGDKKRRFLYQIVDGEHCGMHLHMKCTECGRLLHMNNNVSEILVNEILNSSSFSVNSEQTVLFGKCNLCKKMNSEDF